MTRVVETFMLGLEAELGMLLVHFAELDEVVDHWVIVEAVTTHRGDPKPLYLRDNWESFSPWHDKITPLVAKPDPSLAPWPREHAQRDAAMSHIPAGDGDVVLISDVDEFPPRGFDYGTVRPVVAFDQRMAMYAVDWAYPELHRCSVAATWRYVKANGGLARVRDGRYGYRGVQGGWHLTWLGGLEAQREKLRVTCHTEMTRSEHDRIWAGACYERGVHHGDGGLMMQPVDVDETWPKAIYEDWRRVTAGESPEVVPADWYRPR